MQALCARAAQVHRDIEADLAAAEMALALSANPEPGADTPAQACAQKREMATAGLSLSITKTGNSQWIFGRMVFRSVNGQGLGAFAIHQYEKGARILAERPLASIAVPDKGRISKKEAKLLVDKVIGSLGESQRLAFFSLSQHPSYGDEQSAIGTWLSNVYPTVAARDSNNPSGCDGMGAFAELSRLNHACMPNTMVQWHPELGCLTLQAARDIRCGEELTVAYHGLDGISGMVRSDRQLLLLERFGFHCGCLTCRLTGEALLQSDMRQRRLAELTAVIGVIGSEPRPPYARIQRLIPEVLQLMREERMPMPWAKTWVVRGVMIAGEAGEHAAARAWTQVAAECVRVSGGSDCMEYQRITGRSS